jgi:beta-lactamase class A
MSEPGIEHKFVKGLEGHDELEMYRKSGTWRDFHADSALVETGDQAYVMVALAHSPRGSAWLQHLAEPLHILAMTSQPLKPALKPTLASAPTHAAPH